MYFSNKLIQLFHIENLYFTFQPTSFKIMNFIA